MNVPLVDTNIAKTLKSGAASHRWGQLHLFQQFYQQKRRGKKGGRATPVRHIHTPRGVPILGGGEGWGRGEKKRYLWLYEGSTPQSGNVWQQAHMVGSKRACTHPLCMRGGDVFSLHNALTNWAPFAFVRSACIKNCSISHPPKVGYAHDAMTE